MDSITLLIRDEIKRQYGSIKRFSEASDIPYSTLSNALAKGIGGTAYDTVLKICQLLNLKQVYDADLTIFNERLYEICSMLSELDEQGVHTVKTVITIEYNRCTEQEGIKSFNGISYGSKTFQTNK